MKNHIGRHALLLGQFAPAFAQCFPQGHIDVIGKRRFSLPLGHLLLLVQAQRDVSLAAQQWPAFFLQFERAIALQVDR